ncbi:MAG TPA: TonB-dependent receptor, partial [Segatella copri]|nr:TonB-dependent receptor [Segatella copri]
ALAKYAYYVTRYVNNDETQIHVDNTYRQQEMYFSTSNVYEILSKWSVSMSYDFKWNKLNANMVDFAFPHIGIQLVP